MAENHPTTVSLLGALADVGGLRSFLTFGDLELNGISLLQALVAFGGDRAVVNKNIRAVRAPDKAIPFCVIEPLDGSFQTFHVTPLFLHVLLGGIRTCPHSIYTMHFAAGGMGCQDTSEDGMRKEGPGPTNSWQ